MKYEILLVILFTSTLVQANDKVPSSFSPLLEHNMEQNHFLSDEIPDNNDHIAHLGKASYDGFYQQQDFGHYSFQPVQYPLFHYLPEVKTTVINQSAEDGSLHDNNDALNRKTEQAIKLNHSDLQVILPEHVLSDHNERKNKVSLAGTELSDITASRLIDSARKKQHLETLIPGLLNNQRLFLRDREKLEKLSNDFKSNNKITKSDEIWLQELSQEYPISQTPF